MNMGVSASSRRLAWGRGQVEVNLRGLVILLVLVTAAAMLYAYTAWRAFNLQYEISRGLETQRELMETGRRLKVELNVLRSPERLEREGARLGLAAPKPDQVRSLP